MKKNIGKVLCASLLAGTMLLGGCGKINPDATVVNINDGKDTITLGYANFIARYNQASMETMFGAYINDGYWQSSAASDDDDEDSDKTIEDSTKENVMETLEEQYLCEKHADEYNISLSDEEKKKITEAAEKFMSSNDKDAIEQIGATQEYVEKMLTSAYYKNKVENAIKDATKVEVTDEESVQSKISYVYFPFEEEDEDDEESGIEEVDESEVDASDVEEIDLSDADEDEADDAEDGEEIDGADEEIKADVRVKAENVAAASDFESAVELEEGEVKSYNYTAAADASEDTVLGEKVITEAKKLKKGQISGVIETEDGCYVIRMDDPKDKETTKNKVTAIEGDKKQEVYDDKLEEWKKDVKWSIVDSQWKKVKFNSKFTNKESSDDTNADSTEDTTSEDADSTDK